MVARVVLASSLFALALWGCRSSGTAGVQEVATSGEPAPPPAASAPPPAASAWVVEAPDFDPFFHGLAPLCTREITIDRDRDAWQKSYSVRAPAISLDAFETHFRAQAKKLGLEVLNPIGSMLAAGREGHPTSAGLNPLGAQLIVGTQLKSPNIDAELRSAATGAPKELFDLVAAVGGAGALSRMVVRDNVDLGRDIDITLSRSTEITDAAVADAANKAGLVAKSPGAFGSPNQPTVGSWYLGVSTESATITLMASMTSASKAPTACQNHPTRDAVPSSEPALTPEQQKKAEDDLFEEMMKP
jgi:hypothetical protein